MDPRERYNDPEEVLRAALAGMQARLWTAMPAIVQSFDSARMTVVVQPALKARVTDSAGATTTVKLPLLLDCPVFFPSAGGFTLTFPIAAGDEVLVVFASRCIDAWWQSGGVQEQAELRMHDLSDGFALPGVFSQPRVIPSISLTATQLRSNDGATFIEVADGAVTVQCETALINASESVTVDTPITTFTGEVVVEGLLTYQNGLSGTAGDNDTTITGNITQTGGVLSSEGTALHTHTHGGVQTGGGSTGAPN